MINLTYQTNAAATPPGSASLADVATLAGVSTSTVSRTLTRPELISESTRLRVMEAVERLGYVPNGTARALSMRRTMTIGAIVPRHGGSSFSAMIQALEKTLFEYGYVLFLAASEHRTMRVEPLLRTMLERGVDAVALLGTDQSPEVFSLLARHRKPYVLMWAHESPLGPCVGFEENHAAALVIDHLAGLGHKQIGFIGGRIVDNAFACNRFSGVTHALAKRGMMLLEDALIETEHGFKEGFDAMVQIIARNTRITAMVCASDYLAAGALSALDKAGIAVPGDLSVISFNDNDFAPYLHPPLSTVRLPIREIGQEAGACLLGLLGHATVSEAMPMDLELVSRGSTGIPRVRSSVIAADV